MIVASGLGGVYPRGIPVGTVVGVEREQLGWERVYRIRPAAQPSVAGHVLILHGATPLRIPAAFAVKRDTTDSAAPGRPGDAATGPRGDAPGHPSGLAGPSPPAPVPGRLGRGRGRRRSSSETSAEGGSRPVGPRGYEWGRPVTSAKAPTGCS